MTIRILVFTGTTVSFFHNYACKSDIRIIQVIIKYGPSHVRVANIANPSVTWSLIESDCRLESDSSRCNSSEKDYPIRASLRLACDADVEAHGEVCERLVATSREAMTDDGGQGGLVLVEDLQEGFVGLSFMEQHRLVYLAS